MKDYPRAGLYWMMTSKNNDVIDDCINWAVKVYGKDLPNRYKMKTKQSQLPVQIKERVDKFFKLAGIEEGEKVLRKQKSRFQSEQSKSARFKGILFTVGCFLIVLWFISGFIYGIVRFIMYIL